MSSTSLYTRTYAARDRARLPRDDHIHSLGAPTRYGPLSPWKPINNIIQLTTCVPDIDLPFPPLKIVQFQDD
jgi:hypothetical protein